MKRFIAVSMLLSASVVMAGQALFTSSTKSEWSVVDAKGTVIAKATLTTDGTKSRLDWKPVSGSPSSFVATDGKIYVKGTGSDSELAGYKGSEKSLVPALLLPTTTTAKDKITSSGANVGSYLFGATSASYTFDTKGAASIALNVGPQKYTLKRESVGKASADATLYAVNTKKASAGSRFANLAKKATNIAAGPTDSSASASAGASGVGKGGVALDDGGDYAALDAILEDDDANAAAREKKLKKFQTEGKVGKAGGN